MTGRFTGYRPAARIAEFYDDNNAQTFKAVVESPEAARRNIPQILKLQCEAILEPRACPAGFAPKLAITGFRVTEPAPEPDWQYIEDALTASAKAHF